MGKVGVWKKGNRVYIFWKVRRAVYKNCTEMEG